MIVWHSQDAKLPDWLGLVSFVLHFSFLCSVSCHLASALCGEGHVQQAFSLALRCYQALCRHCVTSHVAWKYPHMQFRLCSHKILVQAWRLERAAVVHLMTPHC